MYVENSKVESAYGLLMFDLWLTNQQKGVFNSRPSVEIEYSRFLYIFQPLDKKKIIKLNSCFSFLKKKKKRKRICFLIFLLKNIKTKNE